MQYPVFLGITDKFVHLYIGHMSARLAEFFYRKAGAIFELQMLNKTMTPAEFASYIATSFPINEFDDLLKKIEETQYEQNSAPDFSFYIEDRVDNVFHNKKDNLTVTVSAYELHTVIASVLRDFPGQQDVYTCFEWER